MYLSVYQPKTLMAAQVTGTYTFGDRQIFYNNVTTGTYSNVYPNSVLLLGSTPSNSDVGRIRVRNITGTYVTIAENDFTLVSGTYLTFIDYIDVASIYPRIIQDPNNAESVIFYKDYDIAYSNQNSLYGTFPCAGPHRATFISSTGTVYYTATGTYNVRGDTVSYLWAFEGGTPTGSTAYTPGYVRYATPGHYRTKLTVTASGTAGIISDTTYRYVSAYDQPGQGNYPPVAKWEITDFSGDRDSGGYSVGLKLWENLGAIEPNALIVLFTQDFYGTTNISLGGNAPNASDILFVGYIIGDTIKFNYKESWVEFKCGSVTEVMKQAEGFSVSCESKATPTTWFELQEMSVQKALYHYLRWHSTVLDTTDFQYTGDNRLVQYFDADRGSLYDAVNSFIDTGLLGETVSDRQGKIWAEIAPYGYENPFADIPFNITLLKQDWIEEPSITEKRTAETSVIEMGGIVYAGVSTNKYYAYLTTAPSLTPYYRGRIESPREGLILNDQTQLNQIAGNYVAIKNANYEDVTVSLGGNYRNIDIAPQERFGFDINSQDTLTPNSLLGWSFRPKSMNWQYNPVKGALYPQVSFSPVLTGTAGQTLLIPTVPPEIGYSYPSLNLPPIPYFTPATIVQQSGRTVLMVDSSLGFIYTNDFDSDNPTWIVWNAGLDTQYVSSTRRQFFITPNGAVWCLLTGVSGKTYTDDRLYRAPYVGGMFEVVIDYAWLQNEYPGGYLDWAISSIAYSPDKPEEIGVVMGATNGGTLSRIVNLWVINYPTMVKGTANMRTSIREGSLSFDSVNKKWSLVEDYLGGIPTVDYTLWILSYNGNTIEFQSTAGALGSADRPILLRGTASSRLYCYRIGLAANFYSSDNNGELFTLIGDSQEVGTSRWSYTCDPTGQYVMGNWTSAGERGLSGDFGYSWVGIPTLPFGGGYCFAYAGGDGTSSGWIAARGVVRYSPNFGGSWLNKEGNLLQIAPIPSIYGVFAKIDTRTI
jgi:hypothetical protein